jgi:hypothetical protein
MRPCNCDWEETGECQGPLGCKAVRGFWALDKGGIEISHDELCTLSRFFNVRANLADPHHYRINEWLKRQIETRRALEGSQMSDGSQ